MKIKELIDKFNCETFNINLQDEITNLKLHSEKCTNGSLFFCIKGNNTDGHNFAKNAVENGAVAVVCERRIEQNVPQIVVKNVRRALTHFCKVFYSEPNKKLQTIAIVGTNGKTTVCESICEVLNASGNTCGKIGTFGAFIGDEKIDTGFTTPDTPELFELLNKMVEAGVKTVCMELSAHAIYYEKADFKFDLVVFTNCSSDHLDFFKTFDKYAYTKSRAFLHKNCKLAVVNADDPLGLQIVASRGSGIITYGIKNPSDVFAIDLVESGYGVFFVMNLFDVLYEINCNRIGVFNVYNLLACATVCALCGVKTDFIAEKIQNLCQVKGRMEKVCDKIKIFVDYAHTPDALKNALTALNNIKGRKQLICVFGCGGNRDKSKRREMGKISGKYSDFTVITSDNSRFEESKDIIGQIESGIREIAFDYITITDREKAIEYAVNRANSGDFILIAGKGAEEYQESMGVSRYFSDRETARYYVLAKYDEL